MYSKYLGYEYNGIDKSLNVGEKIILFYRRNKLRRVGIPDFVKEGLMLDIGCSYGSFMYEMKHLGWKVKGIEMNTKAAEFGINKLGLDIAVKNVEELDALYKFDVITLRMTLEHFYFPLEVLKKTYKLLKPTGELIILVPNFAGIEQKIYKKFGYNLHLPVHITHFTPKTLKKHLEASGFKEIKFYYHFSENDIIRPLDFMISYGKNVKWIKKIISNKYMRRYLIRLVHEFLSILGKTSRMTVYAKPV